MEPAAMLAQLTTDGAALRDAASGHLEAPVPTCPGWTVRDAVEHTAVVYAHKATIVEGALDTPPRPWPPDFGGVDPIELFDEQLHRVLEALRTHDPRARVWTWFEPDQTVGFWVRRMMQETVIHRADVESASRAPGPVPDDVAVDGIDELLERMLAYDDEGYREAPGEGQRVAVRAGDAAWTVTLGREAAAVAAGADADPDASISGRPSDVLLALWNRASYDTVGTSGDEVALAALRSAVAATTQ